MNQTTSSSPYEDIFLAFTVILLAILLVNGLSQMITIYGDPVAVALSFGLSAIALSIFYLAFRVKSLQVK